MNTSDKTPDDNFHRPAPATPEEEAEFTLLNYIAHDSYRRKRLKSNQRALCWLCMSTEQRQEARQDALQGLSAGFPSPLTQKQFEVISGGNTSLDSHLAVWRHAELVHKGLREEGIPWALWTNDGVTGGT